jgi:hypothetical protein
MGGIRKLVSLILMVGAVVALIGAFMGAGNIFQPLADSLSPFDFQQFGQALNGLITGQLGMPFMLFMLGFIGLTMPGSAGK